MVSITYVLLFLISFQTFQLKITQQFSRPKIKSYVSKKKFSSKQSDFQQLINTQQNQKRTINLAKMQKLRFDNQTTLKLIMSHQKKMAVQEYNNFRQVLRTTMITNIRSKIQQNSQRVTHFQKK